MAFISSSNTNSGRYEVPTIQGVSTTSAQTASVQVSTASTDVAAASLSYDTVCAFIATQPNGSQIKYEDITQIDDDDIEEMDIKWNLALLSMRADRFWKKTGKKITIQGSDVAGFEKSKVECFNCHKMGHFAKECRSPRSQDRGKKESYKKDPKVEEPAPKAMIAIDGIGWDWSYMAEEDENHALVADEEEVPTEYALMAKSSSSSDNEVYDDSFCSKSCRKNTKNLNNKIIKLNEELSDCETDLYNYKRGLSQVEARLVEFKKNEIKFCERIRVLERDIEIRDNKIENLRNELEEVKKEKESIDFKIENFDNASKDLDSLLGNQRLVLDKKGLGFNEYNTVPPPPAQVYSPPKKDLSWMGLPEFVDDTVTDYSRPTPSIDVSKDVSDDQKAIWKRNSVSSSEQVGSFDNVVSKPMIRFVKETGCPSVSKVNNTKNSRKPTVKYAEMYRNTSQSPKVMSSNFGPPIIEDWDSEDESEVNFTLNKTVRPSIEQVKFDKSTREVVGEKETPKQNKSHPRGNQRNWNNQKSQQLGKDFVMQNKACYNCGSFEHLKFDCKQNTWVNKGKTWTRVDHDHDNMKYPSTPTLDSAHPKLTSFVKTTHSHVKRPFVRKTAVKNKVWVPTARTKFPTVGSKVPTAKPTVAAVKGNRGKAVKASACWIWKPKQNQPDQGSNLNGVSGIPQDNIDDKGYWDSGCSRHMTGNISYLSEYEPYNGGYVSFGHGGGMITGKGTIKTGKLEFENVYFVKELKYNLFSVSQICDNKNSVLFTDSECLVLGKDFKLVDDTHVLLRTPRQQNMYSIDLKNIVPHKNLTCLIAKASEDESMLWHRRLGHLNFKTMNKLVRNNLVKEENLHVDFLENQPIEKGTSPNWLFNIDSLTKSMNYVPVVVVGTSSTNISGTKEDALKENVSSLRYIALPNRFHEAQMATSNDSTRNRDAFSKKGDLQNKQDKIINTYVSESSGNTNPTAITKDPTAKQVEHVLSSIVETEVPTVSTPVPTECLSIPHVSSNGSRIISRGGSSYPEAPSLGNAMSFENRLKDIFGDTPDSVSSDKVEANLSNMETYIQISPTPTLRIHKVHPKSQIIGPVDTPVQTRQKTKNMEEQSFIATIHQKTNPELLQYYLFSCFLSQEEPKKLFNALKDPSWVEAMQEELLQFKI
ncbi:ribonuclease H-like domain-containing protein [Tanacetum coccineum]